MAIIDQGKVCNYLKIKGDKFMNTFYKIGLDTSSLLDFLNIINLIETMRNNEIYEKLIAF
jgi:hypothetical protein